MCAGEGTRLGPLTRTGPKVLLPVAGEPLLGRLLALVREHGCSDVYLNLYAHSAAVKAFVGTGAEWALRAHILELEALIPAVQAVRRLAAGFREPFFVLFGDVASRLNLTEVARYHLQGHTMATLVLAHSDHPEDSDLARFDSHGRITALFQKGGAAQDAWTIANAGTYVFQPEALRHFNDRSEDFFGDVFQSMLAAGERLHGFITTDFMMDIGTPDRYERVQREFPIC